MPAKPGTKLYTVYEHHADESIIVVARLDEDGGYECHRFLTYRDDSFVLDADSFEKGAGGSPMYVERNMELPE